MSCDSYTGVDILEVMEVAKRYQRYLRDRVTNAAGPPQRNGRLLDFGAGLGTVALALRDVGYDVTCVELDVGLRERLKDLGLVAVNSLDDLKGARFETVYSMNVLEHIEDDAGALASIAKVMHANSRLVIYVPAFNVLFSSMDTKVGHLRRYRRKELTALMESVHLRVESCRYVDCLGFPASLLYKLAGDSSGEISARSVAMYDRVLLPVSLELDRGAGRFFGKNLLAYARKEL